jgi:hypothetical protein
VITERPAADGRAAPANWRTAVLLAGAAALLLVAGCSSAAPAGTGANPAAAPGAARVVAPKTSVPVPWRLVRASGHLHDITLAVPACRRIARIAVHEPKTRAVITVYADAGRACTCQDASQRTVFLMQPINCELSVFDGATSRPPEFASGADTASVTFACPASVLGGSVGQ